MPKDFSLASKPLKNAPATSNALAPALRICPELWSTCGIRLAKSQRAKDLYDIRIVVRQQPVVLQFLKVICQNSFHDLLITDSCVADLYSFTSGSTPNAP